MLPGILNQLGPESLTHLKRLANNVTTQFSGGGQDPLEHAHEDDDDEVPGTGLLAFTDCKENRFAEGGRYNAKNETARLLVLKA